MQITPKNFKPRAAKNSPRFLPALMRASIQNMYNMPQLNFLEPHARFHYPHCLVSYAERSPKRNSINNRTCAYVLGDSGGYSLSKGRAGWVFDWHDRTLADAACQNILNWYDATVDEGITLDVPLTTTFVGKQPSIQKWQDCLSVSLDNVRFMSNQRRNNMIGHNSTITLDMNKSHGVNCTVTVSRPELDAMFQRYCYQYQNYRRTFETTYSIDLHWAKRKYKANNDNDNKAPLWVKFSERDKQQSDIDAASLQVRAIIMGKQRGYIY